MGGRKLESLVMWLICHKVALVWNPFRPRILRDIVEGNQLPIRMARLYRPWQSITDCSCSKHQRGEVYGFEFRKGEGCFLR